MIMKSVGVPATRICVHSPKTLFASSVCSVNVYQDGISQLCDRSNPRIIQENHGKRLIHVMYRDGTGMWPLWSAQKMWKSSDLHILLSASGIDQAIVT
jgi:hypothetical protein